MSLSLHTKYMCYKSKERSLKLNSVTKSMFCDRSGPVTRRGADSGPARSDDSDGSTDSEEELDSPRRIHQTPISTTENMDIDSTANSQSTGMHYSLSVYVSLTIVLSSRIASIPNICGKGLQVQILSIFHRGN